MCNLATKDWRFNLERGNLVDASAEYAWKQAAQPIIAEDEPFNRLMRMADADMEEIAAIMGRNFNPLLWADRFTALLTDYHARAHQLGQGVNPVPSLAREHAYQVMNIGKGGRSIPEADFVLGFLNDLIARDERYFLEGGGVDEDELLRRMRMYQGKMRGSAGWGFVDIETPVAEFDWVLGGVEDHCADCPELANLSPWYKVTLYTTPGAGDTPCLFNCKCWLVNTGTGETSVKPVLRKDPED